MLSQNSKIGHQYSPGSMQALCNHQKCGAGFMQPPEMWSVTQKPLQLPIEDHIQSDAKFVSRFNTGLCLPRPHDAVTPSECQDSEKYFPVITPVVTENERTHSRSRWLMKSWGAGWTGLFYKHITWLGGFSWSVLLLIVFPKAQRWEEFVFWSVAGIKIFKGISS